MSLRFFQGDFAKLKHLFVYSVSAPLSLVRAGNYYFGDGSLNNRGSNGNYWESKANNANNAYDLNFNSGNLNPQDNWDKGRGFSIRCLGCFLISPTSAFWGGVKR